jgi:hypothetical protein
MKKLSLCLAALYCLALPGLSCGGEDNPRPGVKVTETNLCSAIADVACYNMFRCCTGAQIEEALGLTQSTTVEECQRDVKLRCKENLAAVFWSVARTATTINAQAYKACLDAVIAPKETCFLHQSVLPWEGLCDPSLLIQGRLGAGLACYYDHECLINHYCAPDNKCRALPTAGQPCPQFICASGLFCNWQTGNCESLRGIGQVCDSSDECAENLFCDHNQTDPSCQSQRGVGAACAGDYECASGYCVPGICNDGSGCFVDGDCTGLCVGTTDTCYDQTDCEGTCSVYGGICYSEYDCDYTNGEVCNQPECQATCNGSPVCGEQYRVIDYCEDALYMLL